MTAAAMKIEDTVETSSTRKLDTEISKFMDRAFDTMNDRLAEACRIANVADEEIEGVESYECAETVTKIEFLFDFRTDLSHVTHAGDVNPGSLPVLSLENIVKEREAIIARLSAQYCSRESLIADAMRENSGISTLFDGNYAVQRDTCGVCAGYGDYNCSGCSSSGKMLCKRCTMTGHIKCRACYGQGGHRKSDNSWGTCTTCMGHGEFICGQCNGTARCACDECSGSGRCRCDGCSGHGVRATVHSIKATREIKVSVRSTDLPPALSKRIGELAKGDVSHLVRPSGVGNPVFRPDKASVDDSDNHSTFKVYIDCDMVVARTPFKYDDDPHFVVCSNLPDPVNGGQTVCFSPFLDKSISKASISAAKASTPRAIREALREDGFNDIALAIETGFDGFEAVIEAMSCGAISKVGLSTVRDAYQKACDAHAKKSARSSWLWPLFVGIIGIGTLQVTGGMDWLFSLRVPYDGLLFPVIAGFLNLIVCSKEASYRFHKETGHAGSPSLGLVGIAVFLLTAVLFAFASPFGGVYASLITGQ